LKGSSDENHSHLMYSSRHSLSLADSLAALALPKA
jgi:hypothetical protein